MTCPEYSAFQYTMQPSSVTTLSAPGGMMIPGGSSRRVAPAGPFLITNDCMLARRYENLTKIVVR